MCWIQTKREELARKVEAASNANGKASSKGNGSAPEHQISVENDASIFYADEFDHSVAILNIVHALNSCGVLFSSIFLIDDIRLLSSVTLFCIKLTCLSYIFSYVGSYLVPSFRTCKGSISS